jgi:hypothetical protein
MLSFGVIIYLCYHLLMSSFGVIIYFMLSFDVIISPLFIIPENVTQSCWPHPVSGLKLLSEPCFGCSSPRLQQGYTSVERANFLLPGTATFASIGCAAYAPLSCGRQRIISLIMATNRLGQIGERCENYPFVL